MHFISSFSNCKNKVMLLALVIVTTLLLVLAGKRVGQRQRPGRRGELVTETAANLQVVVRDLVLNISGPSHQPWPRRPGCSQWRTRFAAQGSLPPTALVSFPGSGNTWIRFLIEAATGVFTGSVFNDPAIARAGYKGEVVDYTDGTTLLQKTHHR